MKCKAVTFFLSAVALLLCLTVPAYAITMGTTSLSTIIPDIIDETTNEDFTKIGIFQTATAPSEVKNFLTEWVGTPSDQRYLFLSYASSSQYFLFIITQSGATFSHTLLSHGAVIVSCSKPFRAVVFEHTNGASISLYSDKVIPSFVFPEVPGYCLGTNSYWNRLYLLVGHTLAQSLYDAGKDTLGGIQVLKYYQYQDRGIAIEDNGGLFQVPEPEPTPLPTATPVPTPPPYDYHEPAFPSTNSPYTPYDSNLWKNFFYTVLGYIGLGTNYSFLVLAAVAGVFIVYRLFKKFTHSK